MKNALGFLAAGAALGLVYAVGRRLIGTSSSNPPIPTPPG